MPSSEEYERWLQGNGGIKAVNARGAEIAEEAMPSLDEAVEIAARYTTDEIMAIAERLFDDPVSATPDELRAVLAFTRVRFAPKNS